MSSVCHLFVTLENYSRLPLGQNVRWLVIALAAALAILMLTRIVCPHCGHVGATAASLPRVLICSQCEHAALIRSGKPASFGTVALEDDAEPVRAEP